METLLIAGVVVLGFIVLLIIIRKSQEPKKPWWENFDEKIEKTKFSKEDYERDKAARKAIKNQLKDEKKK